MIASTTETGWLLDTVEFDVCRELLRIDEFPVILDVASPGRTGMERRGIVNEAVDALRGRGLVDDDGLDQQLVSALYTLARPEWMIDARLWQTGSALRVLGACSGGRAVFASVDRRRVGVRVTSPYRLVADVVALAGHVPAGAGSSVSLPAETFRDAVRDSGGSRRALTSQLVGHGLRPEDADVLGKMCSDPGGRGQFGAEGIPALGGARRRARRVVAYHDTPSGRYLQLRKPGHGGVWWTTVTPCSPAQLAAQVTEVAREVTDRVPR